jgi:hypothetical protein
MHIAVPRTSASDAASAPAALADGSAPLLPPAEPEDDEFDEPLALNACTIVMFPHASLVSLGAS